MEYHHNVIRTRGGRVVPRQGASLNYGSFGIKREIDQTEVFMNQKISEETLNQQTYEYYGMKQSSFKFAYFGVLVTLI